MCVARPVVLDETTRTELQWLAPRRSVRERVALHSRIILLGAEAPQNLQIAAELKISVRVAAFCRKGLLSFGVKGLLKDAPRHGRTLSIPASTIEGVIRKTTQTALLHATH